MNFNREIFIDKHCIKNNKNVFFIAEAGVNHNGDMDLAKSLVDVAAEAGADAVKFQSFKTENLILESVEKADYQKNTTESGESQYNMLKKLEISIDQTRELQDYCVSKGIIFMTTPFDESSLDDLDELDLPAYKISSTDITNLLFLKKVAQKGKPIILSTGMAYMKEVKKALEVIHPINKDVILLQCTANYPIDDSEANLNIISTYQATFDMIIGYSDHTVGIGASPYAAAMGAAVIEKHFTLDKQMDGPDHTASLNPDELKAFVDELRKVEHFLGSYDKAPTPGELENRKKLQKCIVAASNIKSGDLFTEENIVGKRTGGNGISIFEVDQLVGKKAAHDLKMNDIIQQNDIL